MSIWPAFFGHRHSMTRLYSDSIAENNLVRQTGINLMVLLGILYSGYYSLLLMHKRIQNTSWNAAWECYPIKPHFIEDPDSESMWPSIQSAANSFQLG